MSDYNTWQVANTSPDPHTLGQWNSVATISNGYLGLKGNLAEQRDGYAPVTLINGVYDELNMFGLLRASAAELPFLDPRYFDTAGPSPAIANLPNPLFVQVYVGEREVSLGRGEIREFLQVLDLTTGVYRYRFDFHDGGGRTTRVEMERFASLVHPHRVFMRYTLTPLDHEAAIRVHTGISGAVRSNLTGERPLQVTQLWAWPPERCRLVAHLPARGHEVRLGVHNVLRSDGPPTEIAGVTEHDTVYTRFLFEQPPRGQRICVERYIVLTCSEDLRHGQVADLDAELDAAAAQGFDAALAEQRDAWRDLWARSDVQIDGDNPAQLGLRFCLYHLLAAAPRFSDKLSVPVKLLSGEYYQGNVFYDTDLCIVPFYTFTQPQLARACLNYRWHGLRPAREAARSLGFDGAKLAWQAGPSGEECLGRWWRFTHTNIHVNADVAYALLQYWRATSDDAFMAERGVDLLVEMARFFAARAAYDAARNQYDLRDVTGPDEGHCGVTSDFYTNALAQRNLRWAADALDYFEGTKSRAHAMLVSRLALRADEPAKWRQVADGMTLLADPRTHVFEQFAGFFALGPPPPDFRNARRAGFVPVTASQALYQPDVLMALALLPADFPEDVRRANWDYYAEKSLNLASTSFAMNALVAAGIGDLDAAYRNFIITTGMDLDEALTGRRDTHAGLHGTAAGGAWLAAVFGFGGVQLTQAGLRIEPRLPRAWSGLRFNLVYQGTTLHVAVDREEVAVTADERLTGALDLTVAGQLVSLRAGQTTAVPYASRD